MQSTSTTYNNILATANHYFEVKLNIAGDDYEQDVIFAAKSDSKLFDNEPTIGGTYSGTLEFSLLGDGADVPKMAAVKPYFRAVSGGSTSAWYQKGLYYIDTRSVTHNDSGLTIFTAHCFDAMLKANAPYANSSLNWPAVDTAVVGEIATMMGISVDSRNTAIMNKSYSIPLPTSYTMRDVLSYIGAMYGANWCISDEGKLRIVPIGGSADTLDVGKSCSNLNLSPVRPVYTQVIYEVDEETAIVSGSTDTHVMEAYCPIGSQTAADRVLTTLSAWQYRPFDAVGCWSNPAVEVGDQITVNGESGTIYSRVISFGNGMVMDLSAPNDNYIDHEYTYESPEERRYTRTISGMSTEISNNAEAITLRATKTEAQGYASDAEAAAKAYTDAETPIVNLLPSVYFREASNGTSWTSNGITFTVNADGSVTASGISTSDSTYYSIANSSFTALVPPIQIDPTKKYTISGVPQVTGCRLYYEKYNASKTYMATGYLESAASTTISTGATYLVIYIRIMSGTDITNGVTFYPMLEAGTSASAYVSSHNGTGGLATQKQMSAAIEVAANSITSTVSETYQTKANATVMNLLPSVYYREYLYGTESESNGITWTTNADGSITATGTATANSDYYLTRTNDLDVPRLIVDPTKKYTISGVPSISGTHMRVGAYNSSGTLSETYVIGYGTAGGVSRTIPEGYYKYAPYLRVTSGTALPEGGATWYPMLEIGDTAHAYVSTHGGSYAMESKITQNAENIELKVDETTITGDYVVGKINLNSTTATIAAQHIDLQGAVSITSLDTSLQNSVNGIPVVNMLPSTYYREAMSGKVWENNGVTWTLNEDGSVTATGTATAGSTYGITANTNTGVSVPLIPIKDGVYYTYSAGTTGLENNKIVMAVRIYDSSLTQLGDYNVNDTYPNGRKIMETGQAYAYPRFYVWSGYQIPVGGITIKPMMEKGEVAHDYVPTHNGSTALFDKAAAAQTTANNAIANTPIVNLLPSVYYREYASGKTYADNGITWTVNDDGSITATGTATANADYYLTRTSDTDVPRLIVDPTKKYTISGVPNVSGTHMRVIVYNSSGTLVDTLVIGYGTAGGVSRTIPAGYYKYAPFLRVTNGTALPEDGATWYPMLEIGDTVHGYVSTHNGSSAIMTAAIVSTVSCYYRSTTSTTPTISTSTSIGNSASTDNAWEYVMPYPKKNAYFFTCERYTHADGSVSFSTVRSLSNADYTSKWCSSSDSTYIDGGNIYTGTVNANAIKANETFTQKLYATDFNITGGSVNIQTGSSTDDVITFNYEQSSTVTWTSQFSTGGLYFKHSDGNQYNNRRVYYSWNGITGLEGTNIERFSLDFDDGITFYDQYGFSETARYPATGFGGTDLKYSATATMTANTAKKITFSGQTLAIIAVTSGYQQGYATYVYNGYGNTDLRQHVAVLNTGTSISYVINSDQSISITSTVAANLSIIFLYGSTAPTIS